MSDISESRPNRYYCFGNLPVHTTSFVLAIVLAIFFTGIMMIGLPYRFPSSGDLVSYSIIMISLSAVIYGNRSMKVIYYYPVIYGFRPFIFFALFLKIVNLYKRMSSGRSTFRNRLDTSDSVVHFSDVYHTTNCLIFLYILNIFALDAVYVGEASSQPSYWNKLKKRITDFLRN